MLFEKLNFAKGVFEATRVDRASGSYCWELLYKRTGSLLSARLNRLIQMPSKDNRCKPGVCSTPLAHCYEGGGGGSPG